MFSLLLGFQSDLLAKFLELVEVVFKVKLVLDDCVEESVELTAQLASLPLVLAIDELLDLAAQAIQRSPSLPSCSQICHDHLQPLPLLDSPVEVLAIHVLPEGSLDLRSLLIDEDHVLLLSGGFFLKFSFNMGLPLEILTEVFLNLLGTVSFLQKVDLRLLSRLAKLHFVSLVSLDRGVVGGYFAVFTIMVRGR